MNININTDAVVAYTNKLEKLSKTAMPNVVRQTLNKAALDVKQVTMPKSAKDSFTIRQANFFKANSKVVFASGNNINSMQSMVGFSEKTLKYGSNQSVEDLEQQEKGGKIKGRSFIPMKPARLSNSNNKNVRANARLKEVKKVVNVRNAKGKTQGQKFIKSVIYAGVGGLVLNENNGKETLFRVNSIAGKKFKLTALYSYQKGREVKVKATNFMKTASMDTVSKIEKIYIDLAEKRLMK
jgi:hypothetical protein